MRLLSLLLLLPCGSSWAQPAIPRVWDDAAMAGLELPLARPQFSPKHVSAAFYYQIPVRPIWKSYPIYHPDRMPAGYLEWLQQQEPQQAWDSANLKTDEDWARAGELVFDAPVGGSAVGIRVPGGPGYLLDRSWYERVRPPLTRDGVMPFYRYIIRTKGKIDVGTLACATCHTRVMPDGSVWKGAQGNFPFDRAMADDLASFDGNAATAQRKLSLLRRLYFAPWLTSGQTALWSGEFNPAAIVQALDGRPPGSMTRHRSHPDYPIQIPDLIGVQHRRYLDRTGLQQNRERVDLMRYAALNQGGDNLSDFGGFTPDAARSRPMEPASSTRYSDEQLYALARYLEALQPPPNPNPRNAAARQGEKLFAREGCAGCHTPPLYSNNKLTPAAGFAVPAEHRSQYDILPVVVGTDPGLTLQTRRGTGYYKVPSLRGVWARSAFEHSGRVASLEDWFNPQRPRTVRGHEFGLKLAPKEKVALIAFLKTL